MQYFPTMKIFQPLGNLVNDIPDMNILENTLSNDVMKVSLNKLENQIDILIIISFDGVIQFDDVWVVDLLQDLYLSIGPLSVCSVLKGVEYFLESKDLLGMFFFDFPYVPVGPRANFFDYSESSKNMLLDEARLVLITH